jgi:ADP-heptose:LPS heptosyltransferase
MALRHCIAHNTPSFPTSRIQRLTMAARDPVIHSSAVDRPLVVRYGALGDMVILTVLIRHLHARFGKPVDILASGGWTRPLLAGQPGVGNLYLVNSRRWPYWLDREQQQLVATLRARGPSATWLCDDQNNKTRWLLERAGWHQNDYLEVSSLYGKVGPHLCDLMLRFAYSTPARVGDEQHPPTDTDAFGKLHVTDAQRRELDTWLRSREWSGKPFVLVQPGNKRTMRRGSRQRASNSKYWPEANWADVLRGVRASYPEHVILMLGVPAEAPLNDEILKLAAIDNAYNIARELPLPRLMALAERAFGMISVDTGPAHVAAAVGCPVVTLFGRANPQMYAPRGPNARVTCLTGTYEGEQSMLGITPEQVLSAWTAQHR